MDGVDVLASHQVPELTHGSVLGNVLQSDGRWGRQCKARARQGRARQRRVGQMGGFRGALGLADGELVRASVVDSSLLHGTAVSGRMVTGDGGMHANEHAQLEKVQLSSLRVLVGTPRYMATAVIYGELGVVPLKLQTAMALLRLWGRSLAYRVTAEYRKLLHGMVRRELRGRRGRGNVYARRFVIASSLIFGPDRAGVVLLASPKKRRWDENLRLAADSAVQLEYARSLQGTLAGRRLLAFKPKFGLSRWLLELASADGVDPLCIVRFFQLRNGGHHLQCMVNKFGIVHAAAGCRCGALVEDPPHLFFGCAHTALQREKLFRRLGTAPGIGPHLVVAVRSDTPAAQWQWLNELLDARNARYEAALPEVLAATMVFVGQVLVNHPLYARRQ